MIDNALPPVLVVEQGASDASVFPLDSLPCVMGKPPGAHLAIDSPFVSRRHAEVRMTDDGHRLFDLGSKNGTIVNGVRLSQAGHLLANGDKIELARGQVVLRFRTASSTITLPSDPGGDRGSLLVDHRSREVHVEGRKLAPPLSRKEFDVLELLFGRRGAACSKDQIAEAGWPERPEDVGDQEIEQCVRRIRLRIEAFPSSPRYVITVRGFGYKLAEG